jgi:hypothetical protein
LKLFPTLSLLNFEKLAKQADINALDDGVKEVEELDAAIQAGDFDQPFNDEPVQLQEVEEEKEASQQLLKVTVSLPTAIRASQGIPWRFPSSQLTNRDAEGETQEDFEWDKY